MRATPIVFSSQTASFVSFGFSENLRSEPFRDPEKSNKHGWPTSSKQFVNPVLLPELISIRRVLKNRAERDSQNLFFSRPDSSTFLFLFLDFLKEIDDFTRT